MSVTRADLRRGSVFVHTKWIDPATNKPLRCKVTAFGRTGIYYRAIYDDGVLGSRVWIDDDRISYYASEVIS